MPHAEARRESAAARLYCSCCHAPRLQKLLSRSYRVVLLEMGPWKRPRVVHIWPYHPGPGRVRSVLAWGEGGDWGDVCVL